MLELVKSIRNLGYATGLVTDNKKDRIDHINKCLGLNEFFNAIIISSVVGTGKDNDKIFHKAIKLLEVKSNECVFIDNKEKNLIVPKRMGMKVIFFDYEEKDIDNLRLVLKDMGIEL